MANGAALNLRTGDWMRFCIVWLCGGSMCSEVIETADYESKCFGVRCIA